MRKAVEGLLLSKWLIKLKVKDTAIVTVPLMDHFEEAMCCKRCALKRTETRKGERVLVTFDRVRFACI